MKARAYAYAAGAGPKPSELVLAELVDRLGTQAVYGRALSYAEIKAQLLAERIVAAYQARADSDDWAAWARAHPDDHRLLVDAMKAADGN